ncbi:MAG: cell surface protein SprA [candidate division Zixibacteria bacterium]|nr:cell surface protein SprA [candidate division Zixibacteria bacterium]
MSLKAFLKSLSPYSAISVILISILFFMSDGIVFGQELDFSLDQSQRRYLHFFYEKPQMGLSITKRRQPLLSTKFKIDRKVEVGPEGKWIKIEYTEGGYELYEPLYVRREIYVPYQTALLNFNAWKEHLYESQLKEEEDKEGGLLEYEIPIKFPKVVRSIIGEGGPGLKVTGYRRITFTGKSQWDSGVQSTAAYKQSKFPTLNMEQESKFDITGTIGDKITVSVKQDSKALSDLENRIHLKYTGYEDEIVKSIEAGNTNLSLPNTQFVGYSQNVQGLFGIKAEAQVGNLDLTVITSQEKGSTEKTTFTAGAQQEAIIVRDYEYLKRTYFWLDASGELIAPTDSVVDLKLYRRSSNQAESNALVVVNPNRAGGPLPTEEETRRGEFEFNQFELIETDEYELWPGGTDPGNRPYIRLDRALGYDQILGAWMDIQKDNGQRDTIGIFNYQPLTDPDTSFVLKLIWKETGADSSFSTWENEVRSVYSLKTSRIDRDGFELTIYRGVRGGEEPAVDSSEYKGTPFIQLLGLDQNDTQGNPTPDNLVDQNRINFTLGHLFFPYAEPFNIDELDPADKVPEIYDSDNDQERQEASQYYFHIMTTNRSTSFSLNHTNIIPGSETVRLNGRTLQKGKDYNIMYELGQVTFLTDEASDPNANITIDYEYSPFFLAEKKSLFGTRLVYNLGEQNWIGTTALYKSETTADQKPRVGREPSRNFVWDTDVSLSFEPAFMTEAVDGLPLIETEADSRVNFQAEFAQSIPNPNTKGKAYIDDFESSREYFDLSIFRGPWTLSSRPEAIDEPDSITYSPRRAHLLWYNPYDQIPITLVWPNRQVRESENRTNILQIEYTPDEMDSSESWAGLMRTLPLGLQDQTRTKFIELWMRKIGDTDVRMGIDLGVISEDINGNGRLETEDQPKNGIRDGILDDDEDTGLDGVFNSLENDDNRFIKSGYNATPGDPHGDNWNYSDRYDYSRINGTEGNAEDPDRGRKPDTEDINDNNTLDQVNSYFGFTFDLDDPEYIADSTVTVMDDGERIVWRQYRIPLQDPLAYDSVGSPKWNRIEYTRFWITGADQPVTLQIAQFQLVGNKWLESGVSTDDPINNPVEITETFNVSVINNQENSGYVAPPDVSIERDPATDLERKEQSLVLSFENLKAGHSGSAYRQLYSAEDYTNYETMKMWIYGHPDIADKGLKFFFRMGPDTINNYYEYHTELAPGWAESNEMTISFAELTQLKNAMLTNNEGTGVRDTTEGKYRIHGDPSLTRVLWFVVGVEAPDSASESYTGQVWLNELRVTEPRDDTDWAGRVSLNTKWADFVDLTASYERVGADFHNLLQKRGSGATSTSKQFRGSVSLHKLLPPSWGMNLPVSASWSNTLQLPRLKPGSDIILPEELKQEQRTERTSKTFNVRQSMNMKTDNWFVNATLNRLSGSYSASSERSRSPATPQSSLDQWNLKGTYDLSMRTGPKVPVFKWTENVILLKALSGSDFYPLPTTLTFSGNVNSVKRNSLSISGNRTNTYTRDFTFTSDVAYNPFSSMNYGFNLTSLRDIRDESGFDLKKFDFGTELDYKQRFNGNWRPKLINFLDTKFSYDANYHHNSDPNQQADSTLSVDNGNNVGVETSLNWQKLFGRGKGTNQPRRPPNQPRGGAGEGEGDGDEGGGRLGGGDEEEESGGPMLGSPVWLWHRFVGLFRSLDPLRGNFSRSKNFARSGLTGDPSYMYKFGFTEDPGVETKQVENVGQRDSKTITDSYSLRSGISPIKMLNIDGGYTKRIVTKRTSTEPNRATSVTFPDIDVNFTGLERIGFLKKIASSSSISSGYSEKEDLSENPDTGEKIKKDITKSYDPLFNWSLNWKNGIRTSIRMNTSKSTSEDLRESGTSNNKRRSSNQSITVSFNYSFKAPKGIKLPFLSRIKFDSNMNIGLNISKSTDKSETSKQGLPYNVDSHKENFNFNINGSYSFSSTISGGLKIGWTDSKDLKLQKTHHTRELSIWAEIHF